MKDKIEKTISYIFGEYDMRKGKKNSITMQRLAKFCLDDIKEHPGLEKELNDTKKLEFFVIQSMIYMLSDNRSEFCVEFVLFESLLDDKEENQFGILIDDTLYCLCCFGTFENEDYKIIEKKLVRFDNVAEMLNFCRNGSYRMLFAQNQAKECENTNNGIVYDGILTPQQYLELMTDNYYCLDADNQLEVVERILDERFATNAYWSFSLESIREVIENKHKVVLVEIVNIVEKNNKAEQEKLFRWFEVPGEWTKEYVKKKLSEI